MNAEKFNWPKDLAPIIGRWEANCIRNMTSKAAQVYSHRLQFMWRRWPRKSKPSQVHVTDVNDYLADRLAEGAAFATVRTDLGVLSSFFNYLINELGMELDNPVVIPRRP
jgi:site-specific recombinase XerD